ncbi:MAG: TolC family protein [Desulfuromonadaceae bacterium]|nr:TolC family protein [Desulfuromonadaceae bacterium]
MNMRRTITLLMLAILSATGVRADESQPPAESLATLVATAVNNNPELKSSQARWRMFANKAKQAASLEDPMFMFKLQNMRAREPFVFNKDPQSAKVIGLSQQLPFWGKRAIRQEVAQFEAESYKWTIEERKLELARMVKETYYQIWAVDKGLGIIEKDLGILADFVTIAESKYSVGQGVQQDVFKADLEKSKMLDLQISLQQQRKSLEANLNYLLYRPANTPSGTVTDFTIPQIAFTAEQLNRTALEKRPQIKSLVSLASKGQASHRLAEKEFYPDFNLSFEYMFKESISTDMVRDPGYNMFSLGVTFNLPFQQERRHAMVAESTSETSMATEELNGLKNSISYTINDILTQMERRRKLVELYKGGIIPQAEQALESAVISYRVNKVDFLTLLDSRITLFNYERELYESQADYMMKLAQLEAAVGTELTAGPVAQNLLQPIPAAGAPPDSEHSHHH